MCNICLQPSKWNEFEKKTKSMQTHTYTYTKYPLVSIAASAFTLQNLSFEQTVHHGWPSTSATISQGSSLLWLQVSTPLELSSILQCSQKSIKLSPFSVSTLAKHITSEVIRCCSDFTHLPLQPTELQRFSGP